MVSTLEAIYYAAYQIMNHHPNKPPPLITINDIDNTDNSSNTHISTQANKDALIDLMYLFGIQRAATSKSSVVRDGRPVPFSEAGKDWQRVVRRTVKGSEKHLRDIERGRRLRDEAKCGTT